VSKRIGIAAAIWGFSILLSRVIGLVREAVIGRVLGGGGQADLYFLAFSLPDYLNYLLAGGALTIVFIPIFAGYMTRQDEDGAWASFNAIANIILAALVVVITAAWLLVPVIVPPVFAPGLGAADAAQLVLLTRIILPAQIFHVLGGLLSAVLQARDRHLLPALAPLVYNAGIIGGGLLGGAHYGAVGFAWGVLAGSFLGPFLMPLAGCLHTGLRWRLGFDWRHPDVRAWLWRTLPIMLAFSIIMLDDTVLAREGSKLGHGAVATLQYAKKLMRVPIGVFGLAVGVAAYPTLARLVAEGHKDQAYKTLAVAVRRMLVLAFGAQVVLTAAGPELSRVIYGGRIDASQHVAIGTAIAIFSVALWAWSAQTLISRGFYVLSKMWLPSLVGTGTLLVAYPFYWWMGQHMGTTGLAIASSTAVTSYVVLLIVLLRREYPGVPDGFLPFMVRAAPCAASGIGAAAGLRTLDLPLTSPALRGLLLGTVGGLAYLGAILAIGLPEARDVIDMVWSRVRRRLGLA